MKTKSLIGFLALFTFLLAACSPKGTPQAGSLFPGEALTPFATQTVTPTATSTPVNIPTATLAPTVTSTPITYTVKGNDTFFSIAANHGLTTKQLMAANPSISEYLLSPGMNILIPAAGGVVPTTQPATASTPYPLSVSDPKCTPSLTGGLYCFALIANDQAFMADDISADFILTNPVSGETATQKALVPLNRIPGGEDLPLFAYFPPPVMENPVASLQLKTAVSVNHTGTPTPLQSAKVTVDQPDVNIAANGLSVEVKGQAALDASAGSAGKIWIAAVAYDAQDNIVGIRRYQSVNSLKPGESMPFTLDIYSIGGKIVKVDFFGEANL
jgi:LysM repeat protein